MVFCFLHQTAINQGTGLDIYAIKLNDINNRGPIKLEAPLNSEYDDFGFVINSNKEFGFLTSSRPGSGSDDIYQISFTPKYITLSGKVINKLNKEPIKNANIIVSPAAHINEILTDAEGKFTVKVEKDKIEQVTATKNGFKNNSVNIEESTSVMIELQPEIMLKLSVKDGDTKDLLKKVNILINNREFISDASGMVNLELDGNNEYYIRGTLNGYLDNSLTLKTKDEPSTLNETLLMYKSEVKKSFVLDNIYYDFDKWDILPQSALELDKLVLILKENPGLKVELGSHTDSRGSANYNMKLSQKRSESAVNYIVSKGISKKRISAKGYGETLPYIKNAKTEEEHHMNRRTTFTILEISTNDPVSKSVNQMSTKSDLTISNVDNIKGTNYRIQFHASSNEIDLKEKIPGID